MGIRFNIFTCPWGPWFGNPPCVEKTPIPAPIFIITFKFCDVQLFTDPPWEFVSTSSPAPGALGSGTHPVYRKHRFQHPYSLLLLSFVMSNYLQTPHGNSFQHLHLPLGPLVREPTLC